jgi:hypothetical protein
MGLEEEAMMYNVKKKMQILDTDTQNSIAMQQTKQALDHNTVAMHT